MIQIPETLENFSLISVLDYTWEKREAIAAPRPFHALSFRTEGECTYETNKNEITIYSHDLLFVPAHVGYVQKIKKTEHLFCVLFHANLPLQDKLTVFTPKNSFIFESLFSSMCHHWNRKLSGDTAKANALFFKIISKIHIQQSEITSAGYQSTFQDALEYLHENFTNPHLTVKEISEVAAFSESHFRKQFKALKGLSPIQYINELRAKYALELLQSGYYKVYEVAEEAGFFDSKYFSTVMRKKTGYSPKTLQKRLTGRL
ncbi:MAG: helix-turn-helix transcriptional regulator [Ruminococcaceae bacterium]|nr:helix-turn-helix transcriptional regulator [Oscillospiraceae bacterium]